MCECTMMAEGEFEPITIQDSKLSFAYIDRRGNTHVLIKEFAMGITITNASVSELRENGILIGYQFLLKV